ncbi:MAG: metallophosphoesterase [Candidatus Bathyarchaeia archaeon]|jgi:3',5'-cyclic AMP phosphodiesterase CpdA
MIEIKSRIVHFSDCHISPHGNFVEESFDWAVKDINNLDPEPDIAILSGDLTDNGVLKEYELAVTKLDTLEPKVLVAPGNHDEKNFGQSLFQEMIGPVDHELKLRETSIFITDSPQPDRDEGRLGRRRQTNLEEEMGRLGPNAIKILVFHHHLVSVPFSGRDQDVLEDAGDILDMVLRHKVNLVLMGHRHVRRTLQIYDTLLVNAGTTSSIRTRGRLGHSYNIVDVLTNDVIRVTERNITERKSSVLGTFKIQNPSLIQQELPLQ